MPNPLQPHPFAALFPELPPEEMTQLARDIKERGQLEPIILYTKALFWTVGIATGLAK
jgi:ParB-like chromosome segregation protein Spo0J